MNPKADGYIAYGDTRIISLDLTRFKAKSALIFAVRTSTVQAWANWLLDGFIIQDANIVQCGLTSNPVALMISG